MAASVSEFLYPVIQEQLEHDDRIYSEIRATNTPPPTVPWQIPGSDEFEERDEAGRQRLAEERREIILVCDETGHIKKAYPCSATPDLAAISDIIYLADSIDAFLPPELMIDAIGAFQQAYKSGDSIRDYNIPLGGDRYYAAEFRAYPLKSLKHSYVVFLGDSVYEKIYCSYRPHIYRRDWWWRYQFIHAELWTNSHGFRDQEIVLPKPVDVMRIVCIGGSTTVEGPHPALTYPKTLERLLREKFDTDKIEVINCGVDAAAFHSEYANMPDYLALEPDLIIHYNIINNVCAWLFDAVRESGMLDGKKGKIRQAVSCSRLLVALRPEWFLPSEDAFGEQLGEAVDYLDKMRQAAADAGIAFAVASFATPDAAALSWNERVYFDHSFSAYALVRFTTADYNRYIGVYNRLVRKFCNDKNLLYIPVAENFSGGVDTFADICHTRLRGIELKARIMAEYLEDFVGERLKVIKPQESSPEDNAEAAL